MNELGESCEVFCSLLSYMLLYVDAVFNMSGVCFCVISSEGNKNGRNAALLRITEALVTL